MDITAILAFLGALASLGVAAVVMLREPPSTVQRCFAIGMLVLAAESFFAALSINALLPESMIQWQRWRLLCLGLTPGVWLTFSLIYGRRNYREFLARGRWVLVAAFAAPLIIVVAFWPRLVVGVSYVTADAILTPRFGRPVMFLHVLYILGAVGTITNLERTLRASVGTMRWRIKFIMIGLGLLFGVRIYTAALAVLYAMVQPSLDVVKSAALLVADLVILRSLFRARLAEVDLYVSHTVLYRSLTVIAAGAYLLVMGILARTAAYFGGPAHLTVRALLLLLTLAGLTALLFSDRLRQGSKRFISRHFRRPQYDYRTVWTTFTSRTATITSMSDYCRAVTRASSETLEALSVTIWLADEARGRFTFGGSTSLSEDEASSLAPSETEGAKLVAELRNVRYPTDIDQSKDSWAADLKKWNPRFFPEGGRRVCLPLVAGGKLLGLMVVGDRVRGVSFSLEELDLLRTIGDHAAAGLLSLDLSSRLLEAKQWEAFQAMSSFFVHDLKNTASSLSLMLQNLPKHFDDPAFREDALKAISKGVAKINEIIRRLSQIREKLDIKRVESDLNQVVLGALSALPSVQPINLVTQLNALPRLRLDPEQMHKVVTNLVLNARDAVTAAAGETRIEVGTHLADGWVALTVRDNGAGMTADFVRHCLFRPFQSTKKNGIGIGLFQSKMIVEAHGGRIEVESEKGKGSTFRVLLPVQGE